MTAKKGASRRSLQLRIGSDMKKVGWPMSSTQKDYDESPN